MFNFILVVDIYQWLKEKFHVYFTWLIPGQILLIFTFFVQGEAGQVGERGGPGARVSALFRCSEYITLSKIPLSVDAFLL